MLRSGASEDTTAVRVIAAEEALLTPHNRAVSHDQWNGATCAAEETESATSLVQRDGTARAEA